MINLSIWNEYRKLDEKRYHKAFPNVDTRRRKEIRQVYVVAISFAFIVHFSVPLGPIHELGHAFAVVLTGGQVTDFTLTYVLFNGGWTDFAYYGGVLGQMLVWGILSRILIKERRSMILAAYTLGLAMTGWARYWVYVFWTFAGWGNDFYYMSDLGRVAFTILHTLAVLPFVRLCFLHYMYAMTWAGEDGEHLENPSLFRKGQKSRIPTAQGKPPAVGIAKWMGKE